jgi:hypothetical protein
MGAQSITARQPDAVKQFSVFTENRLGRLHDLSALLNSNNVDIVALTVLDTTDSAIIRVVTDDPEKTRELLRKHNLAFTESNLVVVEMNSTTEFNNLVTALLEAEININYLYSFIPHPHGKSLLALSMEDGEMAEKVLQRRQFRLLRQGDISR